MKADLFYSSKGEIMKYLWTWNAILALMIIIAGYLLQRTQSNASALAVVAEVPTAVAHTIRQATVQITMIQTQWSEPTATNSDTTQLTMTSHLEQHSDKGIGTLLAYEGETVLISHDH